MSFSLKKKREASVRHRRALKPLTLRPPARLLTGLWASPFAPGLPRPPTKEKITVLSRMANSWWDGGVEGDLLGAWTVLAVILRSHPNIYARTHSATFVPGRLASDCPGRSLTSTTILLCVHQPPWNLRMCHSYPLRTRARRAQRRSGTRSSSMAFRLSSAATT